MFHWSASFLASLAGREEMAAAVLWVSFAALLIDCFMYWVFGGGKYGK